MVSTSESNSNSFAENNSIADEISKYLKYWYWFVLAVVVALLAAYLVLRYETTIYRSQAKILIKDVNNSQLSELAAFEDLGFTGSGLSKSIFENELQILRSRDLMSKVADSLGLSTSVYYRGSVKDTELYIEQPFTFEYKNDDGNHIGAVFYLTIKNDSEYQLSFSEDEPGELYSFNQPIEVNGGVLTVARKAERLTSGSQYKLVSSSLFSKANQLSSGIAIVPIGESSVVDISYSSNIPQKSEDILNTLVEVYNQDSNKDRLMVANNTAKFIERRLEIITKDLNDIESKKSTFKSDERLTDVKAQGELFLQNFSETAAREREIEMEVALLKTYIDELENRSNTELLPANLGISGTPEPALNEYNNAVMRRNLLLETSSTLNPAVIDLNTRLNQTKSVIVASLNSLMASKNEALNDIRNQKGSLNSQFSRLPTVEQGLRDIEREQNIKEALFLYLFQKREENAISMAVTTPKAKVVNTAATFGVVSPNSRSIYLGAILAGLLIPFGIIYGRNLLDNKIHSRRDVESILPNIPVVGELPKVESGTLDTVKLNDRSILAEAFRILRTNLNYLLQNKEKVVFVTSTIKGEGKTFIASNLALTLSSTGKRVLLLGADIRNPQIHRYIDRPEGTKGLSEFLYDDKVIAENIIIPAEINRHKIDVVLSGRIPPNPAELLMNGRFEVLIDYAKEHYDYVIVDTAPTLLVTDTLLIGQHADRTIYVVRAKHTDKKLLRFPAELKEDQKLKNIVFAINNIDQANYGYGGRYAYGYRYGYAYGADSKTWWQVAKSKIFRKK
ncbi:MAG: polysaccharide biosynthesis tyrosine autokinase [Leeuwenhoekiella sp.]